MSCCGPKNCNDLDEDREGPSEGDLARFGGDDINCPACGASVYHDAALCHECGHAILDRETGRKIPLWIPLLAAAAALGIILMYVIRIV
ncbi:MAG: hypothetical protein JNK58_01145 [Phycisphaerae bacterium]|nr:hypothetical protein [Phycisphaerae bacterium]